MRVGFDPLLHRSGFRAQRGGERSSLPRLAAGGLVVVNMPYEVPESHHALLDDGTPNLDNFEVPAEGA